MKQLFLGMLAMVAMPAFANVVVCVGDANSCLPVAWDRDALEAIHFASQGSDVTSAVGIPQGSGNGVYTIDFTSNETFNHGAGFATLKASDGLLNNLTFGINPDDTFGIEVAEFDLLETGANQSSIAAVDFSWIQSDGGVGSAGSFLLDNQQTFTIWADPETLASVTIDSLVGFEVAQFKHLRIDPDFANGGGPIVQTDAPGMAALLSFGLVGLYMSRRKLR